MEFLVLAGVVVVVIIFAMVIHDNMSKAADKAFNDEVRGELTALSGGGNAVSVTSISAEDVGYRPVKGEEVFAVLSGVSKMELKSDGNYRTRGASISIPIVKGVRYRVGSGSISATKSWRATSVGRLILTNKAVVFEGDQKNERITWGQIADVKFNRKGIDVHKRTGPARVFDTAQMSPRFAAILLVLQQQC